MKITGKKMLLAAALAVLAAPAVTQDGSSTIQPASPKPTAHKTAIQHRKKSQQKRKASGVHSRQLATGEATRLEQQETGVVAEERDMGSPNRGHVTTADLSQRKRRQTQVSKAVARNQHNAHLASARRKTAPSQRPRSQQRAAAGIKNAQFATGGTAHLKTKAAALSRTTRSHRQATGGSAASGEKTPPKQNKDSPEIHLKEHNARLF